MPRKKKTEMTTEEINAKLAKLRASEAALVAAAAVKQHPELETQIQSISGFVTEVQKAEKALNLGASASIQKEREALTRKIEMYEEKISAIREKLSETDEDMIVRKLQEAYQDALTNLKRAVDAVQGDMESYGVTLEQVVPNIQTFLPALETTTVSS